MPVNMSIKEKLVVSLRSKYLINIQFLLNLPFQDLHNKKTFTEVVPTKSLVLGKFNIYMSGEYFYMICMENFLRKTNSDPITLQNYNNN